jgi:hypothetical protein
MNGPAYVLLALLGCVGVWFVVTVVQDWPQRRGRRFRGWRVFSIGLVVAWAVGMASIVVFARPGSQPFLTGAVTVLGALLMIRAVIGRTPDREE